MLAFLRASARRAVGALFLASLVALFASLLGQNGAAPERRWTFLEGADIPADLAVRGGPWSIEDDATATGARALVSREGSGPALVVAPSLAIRDFSAATRCKGDCGLVFRYRGDARYEVARIDTGTSEAVLASVVRGREHVLARAPAETTIDAWQELRVDASATLIRVVLNGRLLIEASEGPYATSGLVGLWAPSGVAYFDELSIGAVPDSPRALELLPLLARPRG